MTGLFDLHGRVAAVIGGTGVLGGTLCRGLSEAGAAVAVLGRSRERGEAAASAITREGGRAFAAVLDATIPESVEATRNEIEANLGPVDILINAPGVNSATPFLDIQLDEWHAILDANLTSVFIACQVFARAMVARGAGGRSSTSRRHRRVRRCHACWPTR